MALPQLGPRMRKVVKGLAFVLLFLVTFVFAVQMTFPFDRVKQKIVDTLSEKYDVSIGDVERGFMPGKVVFKTVNLKTRPTQADLDRVQQRRHGDAAGAMRSRGFKPLIERGGHAHKTSEVALM